jgi:hypothetical protein
MGWSPHWAGVSDGIAAPGVSVTSISRYPQHLDVFCVGADLGIYSSWWDISTAAGGWADWFRVAGGVAAPGTTITVVARSPSHLDLFAVGSDHGVYSIWWDASTGWAGSWFRVSDLTVAPNTSVAAIARNPSHLDLFAVGSDMRISSIWWDASGGWAGSWFNVSGGVAAPGTSVTAVTRNPDHIDLFAVGSDHGIYSTWWDASSGWAGWFQVAGGIAAPNTSVAAIDRTPTHLDLFAIGTDQRIYSTWWDASGGWAAGWFNVSGGSAAPNTSVSVVARYPTHLDVFAIGTDQRVYSTWWDASSGWAGWFNVSGGSAAPGTSVSALARYPDHLDVFAVGTDHHIDTAWWEDEMYFSMQPQQESNWCWAAVSASVALFYEPASTWTQCLVANNQTGRSDCCGSGASGPCNVDGFLDKALTAVGRLNQVVGGVATTGQIEGEVTYARPLGIRVAWSGGGAHFLCIMGQYSDGVTDYVTVDDPIYGRSNVTYAALQTAYQGVGTWTHTYYTKY